MLLSYELYGRKIEEFCLEIKVIPRLFMVKYGTTKRASLVLIWKWLMQLAFYKYNCAIYSSIIGINIFDTNFNVFTSAVVYSANTTVAQYIGNLQYVVNVHVCLTSDASHSHGVVACMTRPTTCRSMASVHKNCSILDYVDNLWRSCHVSRVSSSDDHAKEWTKHSADGPTRQWRRQCPLKCWSDPRCAQPGVPSMHALRLQR